jgi:hypothetical protein
MTTREARHAQNDETSANIENLNPCTVVAADALF